MMKQCLKAITHRFEFMLAVLLEILLASAALWIAVDANPGIPRELAQPAYQSNLLFDNTLGQVILLVMMPLCVSLCCGDCLFMQMKNGVYQLSVVRAGRKKFCRAFVGASCLAGFGIAVLPFLLSMAYALLAFPLDSGAGYLHDIGYQATMLYGYDYTGHAWAMLADTPYWMEAAMIFLIGVTGALYGMVSCLLTPMFRKNRALSLLILPVGILAGTFCLQILGQNRFVLFHYFIASPGLHLELQDLWIVLGGLSLAVLGLGIRWKVRSDELS